MSVLTTVLIAIAAALIGFIIGFIVGSVNEVDDYIDDSLKKQSTEPNPVKLFNAPLKPKEEVHEPVVTTIIMPKSISRYAFTRRVNKALKDTIITAFSAYMIPYNDETVGRIFTKWRALLPCLDYNDYRPYYQRLDIVCHTGARSLEDVINPNKWHFEAVWSRKQTPDCISYARSHK